MELRFDMLSSGDTVRMIGSSGPLAKSKTNGPFSLHNANQHLHQFALKTVLHCRNGKHVLVAYIMKPKAGYDYLATAAHFAAESSTGTNVNVCTTDDFTKSVDALVYYIDPDNEEMKIAYPTLLFDRNITDGRGMMCSFLTLAIGNNQGSLAAFTIANVVTAATFTRCFLDGFCFML